MTLTLGSRENDSDTGEPDDLLKAIEGHILAETQLMGTYQKQQ